MFANKRLQNYVERGSASIRFAVLIRRAATEQADFAADIVLGGVRDGLCRAALNGEATMEHEYILWVATAAYGLHMTEEAIYDWRGWARNVLKIPAEWNEFYLFNAVVGLLGVCCAMIGWRAPELSLLFPAFMLINAILFHIIPTLTTRVFSPGLFTAIILFLPIGSYCYVFAADDGVLTSRAASISAMLGFLIMMMPIAIQKTKNRPMFRRFADHS